MIRKFKKNNTEFLLLATLVLMICCIYFTSLNYPIMNAWDDHENILLNKHLLVSFPNILYWLTHKSVGCYLPLTMWSYMFDYNIWGFNSFGYHLQNIFWHIVTTLIVFKCFRFFKIKPWIAFFICLIFAIHTQRVESVVWISERKDVLCAAFYFLSIYFYVKKAKNYFNKINYFPVLSFVFFILAILSKPMAVSLPVILLIYEWYRIVTSSQWLELSKENDQSLIKKNKIICLTHKICGLKRLYPFFIVLIIFIPITIITQWSFKFETPKISFLDKIYALFFNYYWYFKETIIPTEFNPVCPKTKPFDHFLQIIVFFISVIFLFIIWYKSKKRYLLFKIIPSVLCFIITLLPVIGLIRLGSIDRADRYSYIPSIFIWFGIGIILTSLISKNKEKKFFLNKIFWIVILILYSGILIISNIMYQLKWENCYTLFNYSVNNTAQSNKMALDILIGMELKKRNYGNVLILANKLGNEHNEKIIALYYRALVIYHYNKKNALDLLTKLEPIMEKEKKNQLYFYKYIRLTKHIISIYEKKGNYVKALEYTNKLIKLPKIDDWLFYTLCGLKAQYQKNNEEAKINFKKALHIKPNELFIKRRLKQIQNNE